MSWYHFSISHAGPWSHMSHMYTGFKLSAYCAYRCPYTYMALHDMHLLNSLVQNQIW